MRRSRWRGTARVARRAAGFFAAAATVGIAVRAGRAANAPVDYLRDIHPLLQARCAGCHGNGTASGGFRIDTRELILRGGASGAAVVSGDSAHSLLIRLVSGLVPGKIMPAQGPRLTDAEIGLLRGWIDSGLPASPDASASPAWQPILTPRRPRLPRPALGSGLVDPVDLLLQPYLKSHHVRQDTTVSESVFARRASLDLLGILPTPAQLSAYLADPRPDRRFRLARALLGDDRAYADHWLSFWNDLLRNDYAGTGYIDGGREPISGWLYRALITNMPYDRFVTQLVNPTPESEGFVKGIVWRGVVNASQTPQMQAAQNISQVFMGVNLKCASCHNSFISSWKLADAYGMAGIYAQGPLEMVRCDRPTGVTAPVKFLYPAIGAVDSRAPRPERLAQLAAALVRKDDGRLARTFVNRLWTRLMGRGLVEPNDEMDNPPWDADLLDWLAADFADNGYDVKRTIERIVTSRAYAMPSVGQATERSRDFVFRGPVVKRMTAEEFVDAVSSVTGVAAVQRAQNAPSALPKAAAPSVDPKTSAADAEATRASLAIAGPLMTALGRPNREQVVTERSTAATTLQALELTNGATLAGLLDRGAARWLKGPPRDAGDLAGALFERALGRPPTAKERAIAVETIGSPPGQEGVEDLLWSLVMLPEFQLVH